MDETYYENRGSDQESVSRAVVLGKWLWILFWLIVPSTIAGIMKNKNLMNVSPETYLTGQILSAACSIVYGAVLLKLSSLEDRYRTAGICTLISAGVSLLIVLLAGASQAPTWSLIFTFPSTILGLISVYYEYNAHSSVLRGFDDELSEKWINLRKWFFGFIFGMLGSFILIFIAPILGAILLLIVAIGIVVVDIVKLVYLYRTAKLFREYSIE